MLSRLSSSGYPHTGQLPEPEPEQRRKWIDSSKVFPLFRPCFPIVCHRDEEESLCHLGSSQYLTAMPFHYNGNFHSCRERTLPGLRAVPQKPQRSSNPLAPPLTADTPRVAI